MSDPTQGDPPQGGPIGPGGLDIGQLFQKARDIQKGMQEAQEAAGRIEVQGDAGGGMVVVRANGRGEVVRVTIEQSLMDTNDRELIEDLLVTAVNQALARAKEAQQQEISKATGGLPIGDISKLFQDPG